MVFRAWSSLCLWLLGLFSWGLGGHLVAVLCPVLAGDGRSDGFGVGYLVGLVSSKLVRFMGCALVWRNKENGWVGGVWSWELLVV
ncbi:hypothetical protein KY290_022318 [Solanum tuberosum]|uniref:Secreted protein n=1 Tax=Solanum tuberosum TaxID=4113 RepID=A0ABQ7V412_SOLTU|nr:hypothetical protein KY289_021447 [Solanum tuberosum]KAH0758825.1 hypothetical protein KY290_022318 [Solanum tuberosum]